MNQEYEIFGEQIIVRTAIPIRTLLDIEIIHRVNEHGTLVLSAALSEENGEDVLRTDWTDSQIAVLKRDDKEQFLFYGIIEKLEVTKTNRVWQVQIKGISETVALDRITKKRSFQNTEMTYMHIVKEVTIGYTDIAYAWNVDDSRTLGQPVIQYEETDWEFLKRLCSYFHGVLVSRFGQESFFFGMGKGKERSLEQAEITAQGFDSRYYQNGGYEDGLMRDTAFYMEVRTKENWQMGDWVSWNERRYYVYERDIVYRNGELLISCRLGDEGTFYQKKLYNEKLVGVRLEGTVRKTEEEDVYLQLDIDEKEGADYPWPWTPETNNLSYCMPELGMKAVLYLGTPEEKDARVVLAGAKIEYDRSQSMYEKRFQTKHHKISGIYPGHIIQGTEHLRKMISMSDRMGIEIFGDTDMLLEADGKIQIKGKQISVMSPIAVTYKTGISNIEVCRDFNFYALAGVHTVGTGNYQEKKGVDDRQDKDRNKEKKLTQDIGHWQASFSAMAAVPAVDFAKLDNEEIVVDLFACGSIPKAAKGSTTVALTEVMGGKKDNECSFPSALRAMEHYTVKGGYSLPKE